MVSSQGLRYFSIFTCGDVIESKRLINLGSAEAISRDRGKAELANPCGLPTIFSPREWYHF